MLAIFTNHTMKLHYVYNIEKLECYHVIEMLKAAALIHKQSIEMHDNMYRMDRVRAATGNNIEDYTTITIQ